MAGVLKDLSRLRIHIVGNLVHTRLTRANLRVAYRGVCDVNVTKDSRVLQRCFSVWRAHATELGRNGRREKNGGVWAI